MKKIGPNNGRPKVSYDEVIIMKLRLANNDDLNFLKDMYTKIVEDMYKNDIKIWNDFYPYEVIKEDVENNNF